MPDCAAFLAGLKKEGIGFRIVRIKTLTYEFNREGAEP